LFCAGNTGPTRVHGDPNAGKVLNAQAPSNDFSLDEEGGTPVEIEIVFGRGAAVLIFRFQQPLLRIILMFLLWS
jgi:hypothetical protein